MNNRIIDEIFRIAKENPDKVALKSIDSELTYQKLCEKIDKVANYLTDKNHKVAAIMAQNSFEWVVFDLACLKAKVNLIAIADFFSKEQIEGLLKNASPTIILYENISDFDYEINFNICQKSSEIFGFKNFNCLEFSDFKENIEVKNPLHLNSVKITYTSGSDSSPKGVCLSLKQIENVVFSLKNRIGEENIRKNFSILSFAILLENIGGIYLPLICGGVCVVLKAGEIGFEGSSRIDFAKLANQIKEFRPKSMILVPQLAKILVNLVKNDPDLAKSFEFIAVGGARISESLLKEAEKLNIPLYQGYGLSEFASVVALNSKKDNKIGSVGKILPHLELKISQDGEILLKNNAFLGYLGEKYFEDEWYKTGDIGEVDENGFLWIKDRKKNIFITSFGRNVSPSWVESEFSQSDKIAQIFVYGEAKPFNVAVISAFGDDLDLLKNEIAKINDKLPDYAKISDFILTKTPFSFENGLLTGNLRPKRQEIYEFYKDQIEFIYKNKIS